jgi:hypothetical protein
MFVTVIHKIHDPEGFEAAEERALAAGLPSSVALPIHAATADHTLGICIWEGESVEAVREVVEGAVGAWANNEYYEMQVDGLTPALAQSLIEAQCGPAAGRGRTGSVPLSWTATRQARPVSSSGGTQDGARFSMNAAKPSTTSSPAIDSSKVSLSTGP